MTPDVLVLGDSHAAALIAGCRALELVADGLSFSGHGWHSGRFSFDEASVALTLTDMPAAERLLARLTERQGANPFGQGIQTICSLGFHTGLMLPSFVGSGHVLAASAPRVDGLPEMLVSEGFVLDYVRALRRNHIGLIRAIAQQGRTVVVAPPPTDPRPEAAAFRAAICQAMTGTGLTVYDPARDFAGPDGVLSDPALLEADGHHGNAEYGRQVVERLFEHGFLRLEL